MVETPDLSSPASPASWRRGEQPREWIEIEPRVKVVALRYERRADHLRWKGIPIVGVTAEDLIQHAWACLFANKPIFDPTKQTLFKYFHRRMDDEFTRIRNRYENKQRYAQTVPTSDDDSQDVVQLSDHRQHQYALESRIMIDRFLQWLPNHDLSVLDIAKISFVDNVLNPNDQADRLGTSVTEVYALRRRLKQLALHFWEMRKK